VLVCHKTKQNKQGMKDYENLKRMRFYMTVYVNVNLIFFKAMLSKLQQHRKIESGQQTV
jgi:hypothetical protein